MNKVAGSAAAAVADVPHGATLLFGGFGVVQGWPNSLLLALRDHGARDLTVVFNTPGVGRSRRSSWRKQGSSER